MSKKKTLRPVRWSSEEEEYLRTRVVKDGIHPFDTMVEINEAFKTGRTRSSVTKKCQRLGIGYDDCTTEEVKALAKELSKPAEVKKAIKEDVERSKLQEKLTIYESKYKYLVKEKSLGDRLVRILKEEVQVLPQVKRVWQPSIKKTSQETAILLLGDSHIGEVVTKEEVYGFGEYNFDIFAKRMKFLANSIKSITTTKLKGYRIDKLVIYCLGDMVSGQIHEELMEKGEEIIFQVLQGSFVVAQFILEMAQMFSEVEVVGVVGNHGRLTKKPPYKRKYVNWDYVFYQFLSTFLVANDRIKCSFPKSFFTVHKIYDWSFVLLHGDNIRSWLSIPWYGLERMMWKLGDLLQGRGIKPHYRIVGHFHNLGEIDKVPGELIINGSIIGGTEYSLGRLFSFDRPTQLLCGCHKEIGLTWRYPLRLDLPEVENVEPYKYNKDLHAGLLIKSLLEEENKAIK